MTWVRFSGDYTQRGITMRKPTGRLMEMSLKCFLYFCDFIFFSKKKTVSWKIPCCSIWTLISSPQKPTLVWFYSFHWFLWYLINVIFNFYYIFYNIYLYWQSSIILIFYNKVQFFSYEWMTHIADYTGIYLWQSNLD